MKKLKSALHIITIIALITSFLFVNTIPSSAQTAEEIQEQLEQKQKELEELAKQLENAENDLAGSKQKKTSSISEIAQIELELVELDQELTVNKLKAEQLNSEIEIKNLEKLEKEKLQDEQIAAAYVTWKTEPDAVTQALVSGQDDNILKNAIYQQVVNDKTRESILGLADELAILNASYDEYQDQLQQIEEDTVALQERKEFLDEQIRLLDEAIARADSNADGVRAKLGGVQQEAELLESLLEQEGSEGEGGSNELVSGEIYFHGTAIQPDPPADVSVDAFGHGLGLSQWGAYGAGNAGMSAEQILSTYYKDTHVEARTGYTINVQGYGVMSIDDYAAGLGEIPSKACGTLQQIEDWAAYANSQGWAANDARRNKYVLDNPSTVWDCWPEEAIKAQVIAARSYGITSAQPICTSAACQVYIGGNAKQWAAWETSNKFIISDGYTQTGQIIRAYYSAYNHNGWGSADHATVWGANDGNTTSYSYLRAAYDAPFTYNYTFYRSEWKRTNSYSMQDLQSMINWCSTPGNCNTYAWLRDNVKNKIGNLQSLVLEKDASGRVRKVILNGDAGSASTSGRYFRSVFNKWIENVQPSGEIDKIPSITFSATVVE